VGNRKISWVDQNSICLDKEVGGSGVRRIRKFNLMLLGKWCWRQWQTDTIFGLDSWLLEYGLVGGLQAGGRCGGGNCNWVLIYQLLRQFS